MLQYQEKITISTAPREGYVPLFIIKALLANYYSTLTKILIVVPNIPMSVVSHKLNPKPKAVKRNSINRQLENSCTHIFLVIKM